MAECPKCSGIFKGGQALKMHMKYCDVSQDIATETQNDTIPAVSSTEKNISKIAENVDDVDVDKMIQREMKLAFIERMRQPQQQQQLNAKDIIELIGSLKSQQSNEMSAIRALRELVTLQDDLAPRAERSEIGEITQLLPLLKNAISEKKEGGESEKMQDFNKTDIENIIKSNAELIEKQGKTLKKMGKVTGTKILNLYFRREGLKLSDELIAHAYDVIVSKIEK